MNGNGNKRLHGIATLAGELRKRKRTHTQEQTHTHKTHAHTKWGGEKPRLGGGGVAGPQSSQPPPLLLLEGPGAGGLSVT